MNKNPLALSVLNGRHRLEILGLAREADAFTVDYAITPALPDEVFLVIEAVDDLSDEYRDGGGARGRSLDGLRTLGSASVQPGPRPGAGTLTLTFGFLNGEEEARHELSLPLADTDPKR